MLNALPDPEISSVRGRENRGRNCDESGPPLSRMSGRRIHRLTFFPTHTSGVLSDGSVDDEMRRHVIPWPGSARRMFDFHDDRLKVDNEIAKKTAVRLYAPLRSTSGLKPSGSNDRYSTPGSRRGQC